MSPEDRPRRRAEHNILALLTPEHRRFYEHERRAMRRPHAPVQ